MAQKLSRQDLMDYIKRAIANEQRKKQNQIGADDDIRQKHVLKKELSDMRGKVRFEMQKLDEKLMKLHYTKQELDELILKAAKAIRKLEQLKQIRY
tara:strand:+ start:9571 stop:9858 length:288 start_codon:yes stop_codon:yes gene_type:complete